MRRYVLRRVVGLVGVLLVTSFLVFASLHLAPGSPETFLLQGKTVSEETVASIRAQYHLDEPFLVQYGRWLSSVVRGDLGRSLIFRQEVSELIRSRLPITLSLAAYSTVLILSVGLSLGAVSALRRGRTDQTILIGTTVAAATPSFVAAIVLITVFAVRLGWFPVFGVGQGPWGRIVHLTLPAVALSLSYFALVARVTRAAMIDELGREHVETARSRGIPERTIVRRHVFRNALAPIATISGIVIAGLLTAAVVVESAFGLPGLGSLLVQSVNAKDFPVVQAVALIMVTAFVVTNLIVDLLYGVIDPRVRLGEERDR
jgi:peptide/nickel transport system permease protein